MHKCSVTMTTICLISVVVSSYLEFIVAEYYNNINAELRFWWGSMKYSH